MRRGVCGNSGPSPCLYSHSPRLALSSSPHDDAQTSTHASELTWRAGDGDRQTGNQTFGFGTRSNKLENKPSEEQSEVGTALDILRRYLRCNNDVMKVCRSFGNCLQTWSMRCAIDGFLLSDH